ncbi:MAG: nucleotidyltransferase domain-containing protein [Caldilineaceae bacterium]
MTVNPNLIIPVGTQVVTSVEITKSNGDLAFMRGAVGVVVSAPTHRTQSYRVRLIDGTEAALNRSDFVIRNHFTDPQAPSDPLADYDLNDYVIYRCIVGSRAYGLDHAESDTDRRGIYLPPAELHWSLYGVPEQLENDATQECYWELQKFIVLALKANPNILECLYTPLVEKVTPLAEELRALRASFLSQLIYQTYNGYVTSQFRKLQQHWKNEGEIRWKHAMHLIRLLLAGVTALQEGYVPVDVGDQREALLAVRRGEMRWDEIDEWRLGLHREFDAAFQQTTLPERPDYEAANTFLIKARRSMVTL